MVERADLQLNRSSKLITLYKRKTLNIHTIKLFCFGNPLFYTSQSQANRFQVKHAVTVSMKFVVAFFALLVICVALDEDTDYGHEITGLNDIRKCKCIALHSLACLYIYIFFLLLLIDYHSCGIVP